MEREYGLQTEFGLGMQKLSKPKNNSTLMAARKTSLNVNKRFPVDS